jgi:hypothetical protein
MSPGYVRGAIVLLSAMLSANPAFADANTPTGGEELALGIAGLKVVLPSEDWEIAQSRRRPDDNGVYYLLTSGRRGLVFSFFLEKNMPCKTAAQCRDQAMGNPAFRSAKHITLSEVGRYSVATFELEIAEKPPIRQTHLLAETFVNGIEVDIHISRTGIASSNPAILFEFLNALTFQ